MVHDKFPLKISLTGALLISALLAAFFAPRWNLLDKIDSQMFHVGTWLLPSPKVNKDVYTVQIPADLIHKPGSINQLRQSLNRLKKYKSSSIALILPQLPALDFKTSRNKKNPWQPSSGELSKLAWQLDNNNIIVGIPVQKRIFSSLIKSDHESYLEYLNGLLFSKINSVDIDSLQNNHEYKITPYLEKPASNYQIPLVWASADQKITLGLALEIYKNSMGNSRHRWIKSKGIKVGRTLIPTNPDGTVMGYYPGSRQDGINQINLKELMALNKK